MDIGSHDSQSRNIRSARLVVCLTLLDDIYHNNDDIRHKTANKSLPRRLYLRPYLVHIRNKICSNTLATGCDYRLQAPDYLAILGSTVTRYTINFCQRNQWRTCEIIVLSISLSAGPTDGVIVS